MYKIQYLQNMVGCRFGEFLIGTVPRDCQVAFKISAAYFCNTPELCAQQTDDTQNVQHATQNKMKLDTRIVKGDSFGPCKIMQLVKVNTVS
jgi:hypothetical protein